MTTKEIQLFVDQVQAPTALLLPLGIVAVLWRRAAAAPAEFSDAT